VDILYAVLDFRDGSDFEKRVYMGENELGDGQKDGVFTFRLDSTIHFNPSAKTCVETALCDWTQTTGIQWKLGPVSPKKSFADNDSTNLIYMSNQFLGGNADATAYVQITGSRLEVCAGSPNIRFLREVDVVIRKDLTTLTPPVPGYYFGTTGNPGLNMDFYSVVLHELGHAHLLRHALPDTKIMYPFLPAGTTRRTITGNDSNGGIDVLDSSAVKLSPYPECAMPIQKGINCLLVSVNETLDENTISVFPNPTDSRIHIQISSMRDFNLVVYNILGQPVFSKYFDQLESNIVIDLPEEISPGLYYLSLEKGSKNQSVKVLKN
jgi:Secretion system C-terminal sorting domain